MRRDHFKGKASNKKSKEDAAPVQDPMAMAESDTFAQLVHEALKLQIKQNLEYCNGTNNQTAIQFSS